MMRRLWRRRSLSLPRLTVKKQTSWPIWALFIACVGGAGVAALVSSGDISGIPGNVREELEKYKGQVNRLNAEREKLLATADAAESRINMERSSQKQLLAQINALESENMRLKEDLAFFESLLPNATGPKGISIRRLKLNHVGPGQLRYRMLIVQGGNETAFFTGNLQISVSVRRGNESAKMAFPDASPAEQQKFRLRFRHYQRVEGVLSLPEDAIPTVVQARIVENGQLRAQLSANL